jgi:hypothetical protein
MIRRIVDAVITQPLLAEWAEVRDLIAQRLSAPQPDDMVPQKRRATPFWIGCANSGFSTRHADQAIFSTSL